MKCVESEPILMLMDKKKKENGKITSLKIAFLKKIKKFMKVSIKMEWKMEKAYKFLMIINIMDTFWMIKNMDKEQWHIIMEINLKVNLKMIWNKEKEH